MHKIRDEMRWASFFLRAYPESQKKHKLLIYIGFKFCLFSKQANKSLDLQGSAMFPGSLSTKLSTENLDDL